MAKVKKIRRAQDGEGLLRSCKIDKQGRRSCGPVGQGSPALSGRTPRISKEDERRIEAEMAGDAMLKSAKKLKFISTSPGVRSSEGRNKYKKGSESFFGGDKDPNEARYGRKVAKKSSVKKAKSGSKVKSIKKSIKKK